MNDQEEEPPSTNASPFKNGGATRRSDNLETKMSFMDNLKRLFAPRQDTTLRETIEEYIEDESYHVAEESVTAHEKILISNVLDLRDMSAADIMVPRADIVAIPHDTTEEELFALLSEKQYSRLPVYKGTLDHVIGSIHVKDILAVLARKEPIKIMHLVRDIPIVSPTMQMLDLLLQMRITKKHMVLVIDEFGGIDGLITIGDVIESIVGELDDEHDHDQQPEIMMQNDSTIKADARVELQEFEDLFGAVLHAEERDENETLGGLVVFIAGRVPTRGEVIHHKSGIVFEILEADPRRVKKLLIRNIPTKG